MAENETNQEAKKTTTKADVSKFDDLSRQYRTAASPEARAKIVSENPDLMKQGVLNARRLEREALPLITAGLHKAEETTVGSVAIGACMIGGGVTVGTLLYTGGKWLWNYFRPV